MSPLFSPRAFSSFPLECFLIAECPTLKGSTLYHKTEIKVGQLWDGHILESLKSLEIEELVSSASCQADSRVSSA